jgi:hypothetical protein
LKDELALILSLPVSFIIVLVIKLEDGGLILYPVRNSSGALNPVRDLSLNGINPAGIILKSNPAAEQRGIISNGVNGGPEREMVSCLDF